MIFLDQWGFVIAASIAVLILLARPRWVETLRDWAKERDERVSREYETVASGVGEKRFKVLGTCLVVAWGVGMAAGISNAVGSWSESTTALLRWITALSLLVVGGILGFLYVQRRKTRS